jgi:hypothetical protein
VDEESVCNEFTWKLIEKKGEARLKGKRTSMNIKKPVRDIRERKLLVFRMWNDNWNGKYTKQKYMSTQNTHACDHLSCLMLVEANTEK